MTIVLVVVGALCLPGYSDGRMMHAVFNNYSRDLQVLHFGLETGLRKNTH